MKGIRAAVCHDIHSAHQSVEHDDVNVMCIGAQIVGAWLAKDLVSSYLSAEFSTTRISAAASRSCASWTSKADGRPGWHALSDWFPRLEWIARIAGHG